MFRPVSLSGDPGTSQPLLEVLTGAIQAVDPRRAVCAALADRLDHLAPAGTGFSLGRGKVRVLALGKAATAMAWGVHDALDSVPITGLAATPVAGPAPPGIEVLEGSHPSPDHRSATAGSRLLSAATDAAAGDLVLVLVSGGGSAVAEVPNPGLRIAHIADVTAALLTSGAPIIEINTVRRALSLLKGGGLAAAAAPARVVTLIVSDVVGNDVATIAGGPTVPDPTGPRDALDVLDDRGLTANVPAPVITYLRHAPTSRSGWKQGPVFVVADGAVAAEGALATAQRLGFPARIVSTRLVGEARAAGVRLASLARRGEPHLSVFAGETTVAVEGNGSGGRNQEVALAAAIALDGEEGTVVASLGTDGIDGPTAAAGGIVDGGTMAIGNERGLDAAAALASNDSGTYLEAVGGRLVTGPTGTNVGDVMIAWRQPRRATGG